MTTGIGPIKALQFRRRQTATLQPLPEVDGHLQTLLNSSNLFERLFALRHTQAELDQH